MAYFFLPQREINITETIYGQNKSHNKVKWQEDVAYMLFFKPMFIAHMGTWNRNTANALSEILTKVLFYPLNKDNILCTNPASMM